MNDFVPSSASTRYPRDSGVVLQSHSIICLTASSADVVSNVLATMTSYSCVRVSTNCCISSILFLLSKGRIKKGLLKSPFNFNLQSILHNKHILWRRQSIQGQRH